MKYECFICESKVECRSCQGPEEEKLLVEEIRIYLREHSGVTAQMLAEDLNAWVVDIERCLSTLKQNLEAEEQYDIEHGYTWSLTNES